MKMTINSATVHTLLITSYYQKLYYKITDKREQASKVVYLYSVLAVAVRPNKQAG
jgi:hypothetical protein